MALGGTAIAATGGTFLLGKPNAATSKTSLSAPISGKALQLTNTSKGAGATALGLNVASGHAPFAVNSGVKVANLNADKLDRQDSSAFARNGSERWHEVAAGGPPGFNDQGDCQWSNFDPIGHNTAAFLRDSAGFVHLRGMVKAKDRNSADKCGFSGTSDQLIFNLPVGYRPGLREVEIALSNGQLARVNIDGPAPSAALGAGSVSVEFPATTTNAKQWLSLDGISFRCHPAGASGCP